VSEYIYEYAINFRRISCTRFNERRFYVSVKFSAKDTRFTGKILGVMEQSPEARGASRLDVVSVSILYFTVVFLLR